MPNTPSAIPHRLQGLKILFVSHEASATGAPILLLNFAEWLKTNVPNVTIHTIVIKDGVFLNRWKALGSVTMAGGLTEDALSSSLAMVAKQGFDVIYCNTIETSHILRLFHTHGGYGGHAKYVLHIHEMEGTVQMYGAERVRAVRDIPDAMIAVSEPVRANLCSNHGFHAGRISVIAPCARDFSTMNLSRKPAGARPMVLGCGEIAIVKGTDLFVQVCHKVTRARSAAGLPPVDFTYVGMDSHKIMPWLRNDTVKLGIQDVLTFTGHTDDVSPWFAKADVFFLSSREDSCPLVCLEAASLGLPIVYFEKSGGMDYVLGDHAGFPAPYMDLDKAAEILSNIIDHPENARRKGLAARELYRTNHAPDAVFSRILGCIDSIMTERAHVRA